jgi:hypothetical protein
MGTGKVFLKVILYAVKLGFSRRHEVALVIGVAFGVVSEGK